MEVEEANGEFDGEIDNEEETVVEQQNINKVCVLSQIPMYHGSSDSTMCRQRKAEDNMPKAPQKRGRAERN